MANKRQQPYNIDASFDDAMKKIVKAPPKVKGGSPLPMTEELRRQCTDCRKFDLMINPAMKPGGSFGLEHRTCTECGKKYSTFSEDEPLIPVNKD